MKATFHALLPALFLAAAASCELPPEEEWGESGLESRQGRSRASSRLTMNGLSANRLTMNRLSMNRLTMNSLSTSALMDSEEGRELLSYIVRCALPEGSVLDLSDTWDQEALALPGLLGLAPEWSDEPLSPSGQRWVSACLLAHVNGFGVSVPISLRGPHPELEPTPEERGEYSVQEAAFYGNLFLSADRASEARQGSLLRAYACDGYDIALGNGGSDYLSLRICGDAPQGQGSGTACGFRHMGSCGRFGGRDHGLPACGHSTGHLGWFAECADTPGSGGHRRHSESIEVYEEVITVFLENTDWLRGWEQHGPPEEPPGRADGHGRGHGNHGNHWD